MANRKHIHADHLSAAPYIKINLVGKRYFPKIIELQKIFGKVFNSGTEFELIGSQFDVLFKDNDSYKIGQLDCKTMLTQGKFQSA